MLIRNIHVLFTVDGIHGRETYGITALLSVREAESEAWRIFWQRAHECGLREKRGSRAATYRYVHDVKIRHLVTELIEPKPLTNPTFSPEWT